nr:MAG TPA: hypothetical protein [Caudoviricetes sp.]
MINLHELTEISFVRQVQSIFTLRCACRVS